MITIQQVIDDAVKRWCDPDLATNLVYEIIALHGEIQHYRDLVLEINRAVNNCVMSLRVKGGD